MITHLIGYLVVLLVLTAVKEMTNDDGTDPALPYILCVVLIFAVVVFWLLAHWGAVL